MNKRAKSKDFLFKLAFIGPSLAIYGLVMVIPILFSAHYSLNEWNGIGPMTFVGFQNFRRLFSNSDYLKVTLNTLTLVGLSLLITIPLAASLAYLIYRTTRGFKFFRMAVFMPVIISPIIIGLIFSILLNADFGPVNQLLISLGLPNLAKAWLSDPQYALYAVIAPQLWQNIGYYTIIFLAGMQSVPKELIESSLIDGANSFVVFTRIVLPLITEISKIIVILVVTGALKSFGFSWSMTTGGPGVQSTFFTVYMYNKAFIESNFGMSSAVSINVLVYAFAFTILFQKGYAWLGKEKY